MDVSVPLQSAAPNPQSELWLHSVGLNSCGSTADPVRAEPAMARPQQAQQGHAGPNNVGTFGLAGYTDQAGLRLPVYPSESTQDHQVGRYAFMPVPCQQ